MVEFSGKSPIILHPISKLDYPKYSMVCIANNFVKSVKAHEGEG